MGRRDLQTLIAKLEALPSQRLAEVEAFVDFLRTRGARDGAAQRLERGMARVEQLGRQRMNEGRFWAEARARLERPDPAAANRLQRMSEDEQAEIRAARRKWRDLWAARRR